MKRVEIIFGSLAVLGLIARLSNMPGGIFFVVIFITLLSILYFVGSIFIFRGIRLRDLFKASAYEGYKAGSMAFSFLCGMFISTLIIAVLFKIALWPGEDFLLISSVIWMLLIAVVGFVLKNKLHSIVLKQAYIRLALYSIIGLLFWSVNSHTLIDHYYGDTPEIAIARKKAFDNPNDPELMQRFYELKQEKEMEKYNAWKAKNSR